MRGENMKHEPRLDAAKDDPFDVDIQSCSATDCTGLIPSAPESAAELEHYNQLYQFLPCHVKEPEKQK